MPFSDEDKTLVKNLYQFKEYGSRSTLTKLPNTNCKREGLDTLLKSFGKQEAPTKGDRPKHARVTAV